MPMSAQNPFSPDSLAVRKEKRYRAAFLFCMAGAGVSAVIVGILVKFFGAPFLTFWVAFAAWATVLLVCFSLWNAATCRLPETMTKPENP
jgi:hypothetical protein